MFFLYASVCFPCTVGYDVDLNKMYIACIMYICICAYYVVYVKELRCYLHSPIHYSIHMNVGVNNMFFLSFILSVLSGFMSFVCLCIVPLFCVRLLLTRFMVNKVY